MGDHLLVNGLDFFYGQTHALRAVTLPIRRNRITSLIGPSGCGKTTLLRCFNRMHDLYPNNRYRGEILMDGRDILGPAVDVIGLRNSMGMVFQKPTPFPMSVFDNVAYGLRLKRVRNAGVLRERVEKALRQAAVWDEVKDRLGQNAQGLSGGQQQRLVIARTLAVDPQVILFDESTSALDPISSKKIEELMTELKKEVTIIAVTHNMQQAARISDFTALMYLGSLVEYDETATIFTKPRNKLTEEYVTGRFG
ncbi:MAG: phosphate ABC transporter ATP-binding protein PstB [Deltaproteobacteria bacterium]|jgi:phosphate transport system ATP-binding protein|nr:phosphate ABC transporter ATP-binding protein PstB [Deltaproteobacteria bacterium]